MCLCRGGSEEMGRGWREQGEGGSETLGLGALFLQAEGWPLYCLAGGWGEQVEGWAGIRGEEEPQESKRRGSQGN